MRSSDPFLAMALSLTTSSSSLISLFCRKTWPLSLTETVNGSRSWSMDFACVCGRSMGTPTVSKGAATMKMMSSTSITSTMGVTLIWLITGWRCPRCPRDLPPCKVSDAIAVPLRSALVELARQDRRELVGEAFQPLRLPVHVADELVIENGRRYGGNENDCGGKQRLRDARRHNRQRSVLRGGDGLEAGHDAPDGAE